MSELSTLVTDGFTCTPTLDAAELSIVFAGSGDMHAVAPVADYLKQVHELAVQCSLSRVSCDFRSLTFMNSSCFKAFVVWIDTVKNAPQPYAIRFLTDPNLHWQRRSLEALRRLAMQVVSIEN